MQSPLPASARAAARGEATGAPAIHGEAHDAIALPRPSFRQNFTWSIAGNAVYAACQWGVLAIIAKLGSPGMVGTFALGLAISAPIFQFANMHLRGVQATDARREHPFSDYFTLRLLTTVLALAAMATLLLGVRWSGETALVMGVIAGAKAVDAVSDVFFGRFQQQERMDLIARAQIANGALSIALLGLGLWLTGSLLIGTTGFLLASLAPLLAYVAPRALVDLRAERAASRLVRWDARGLERLARTSLPLGVVMLLVTLTASIPTYVIEQYSGKQALGVFAALANLILVGTTVVNAMGQAASPRLARQFAAGDYGAFTALLGKLMLFGALLGAGGTAIAAVAGDRIVALVYSGEYARESGVLTVLAIAATFAFAASFAGYGITAMREYKIQVPMFAGFAALSLLGAVALVPRHGIAGAAVVALVVAIAQLVVSSIVIAGGVRKGRRMACVQGIGAT